MSTHDITRESPAWLLVARREVLVKLTDKTFIIGTLVMVAVIAGFMAFSAWQDQRTQNYTLATVAADAPMAEAIHRAAPDLEDKATVKAETVADAAAAKAALEDGSADGWLHRGDDGWVLTTETEKKDTLTRVVERTVSEQVVSAHAQDAGTTMEQLQEGATVTTAFLRGDSNKAAVADAVGFAFAFLFYLAAMLFGMQLASSVIEEKQSRIVEIIAAAIPLRQLLAGKIIGNTVLAMVQVAAYVAVGLIGMSFTPYGKYVPQISGPVVWFVGFFLAGFVALACLWAIAGALASRSEDLQSTTTPLTTMMMLIFFAGLFLEGKAGAIASFVPPLSAVLMPKRILAGDVGWWQPVLALGLLAAFAAATLLVGERIYRRALMQTGGKVSLRQAWATAE